MREDADQTDGRGSDGETDGSAKNEEPNPTPASPVVSEHLDQAAGIVAELDLSRIGPTRSQLRQIEDALAAALASGLDRLQVQTHAHRKAGEAQTVKYFLGGLTAEHMPAVEQTRPARPAWCADADCDERTRLRDLPDGSVCRCPKCHPLAGQTPAQAPPERSRTADEVIRQIRARLASNR